jgi:hypothetical protein
MRAFAALRRKEEGRALGLRHGIRVGLEELRDTQVSQLRAAVGAQQDVVRLDVAVHYVVPMHCTAIRRTRHGTVLQATPMHL